MPTSITPQEWLRVIKGEYLNKFILDGGSSIKFIVPLDDQARKVAQHLSALANEEGFQYAQVLSSEIKIHQVDKIFNSIATQIDWDKEAISYVSNVLREHDILVPKHLNLSALAEENGWTEALASRQINLILRKTLFDNSHMTQEFKIAMSLLIKAVLQQDSYNQAAADLVKAWLRGEVTLMGELRKAHIVQKINKNNARNLIASLASWLHDTRKTGLILFLDISKFLNSEQKGDIRFSKSNVIDGYEVLRQFVDSTDELRYCLVVVAAPIEFLSPDDPRGIRAYDALRLRIWDDVKDTMRVNPLSPLIRLSLSE